MNACWLLTLCMTYQPVAPAETPTTALALSPAAEPVPSLKYRLLPELRDLTPGNAIMGYYRAYSPEWQSYRRDAKWSEPIEKALEAPLSELRESELARKVAWVRTSPMLREVDRAARRTYFDWEMTDRIREDGVHLMVPDVQGMREFARLLAVRVRLEMAEGNFDAAVRTLQTGYALARHAGDGPTLIHSLVGIAIASIMNQQLETWVQTPGAPNLYWSLTDLPVSFIDLRKALQGERLWSESLLPQFREVLKDRSRPPFSAEQMREAAQKLADMMGIEIGGRQGFGLILATAKYPGAKKFLAEQGWTAAQIEAMPALQAVFMQEMFEYDRFFDLLTRGANLPYAQGQKVLLDGEHQLKKVVGGPPLSAPIVAKLMLPAIMRTFMSRARVDRQIAALRTVEAIRMHAATSGKLPANLEAISVAPVPLDPITGQAFQYTLTGDKATLAAAVLPGEAPSQAIRYEITLKK